MPIIFIFVPLSDTLLNSEVDSINAIVLDSMIYTRFKETIGGIVSSIAFLEVLDCLKLFKS